MQTIDQLIKHIEAMNKKLNKDFLRRLPLDLRQDEYVTCVQLCDVIKSCQPVLAYKFNSMLDFFKNSPHHVKKELLNCFKMNCLKVRDSLENLPSLKVEMDTFWELKQKVSNRMELSQDEYVTSQQLLDLIKHLKTLKAIKKKLEKKRKERKIKSHLTAIMRATKN
ncbi:hypothetical protein ACKWTF_001823 [Chironomus riparius]